MDNDFNKITEQTKLLENLYKESWKKLNDKAEQLEKEKEAFKVISEKIEKVHFSNVVTLNIGGSHFTTSLSTLTQEKETFFAKMFSGNWALEALPDGSYFIDRDGTNFRYLLNYLRTGKVSIPDDEFLRDELIEEATFYNIQSFIEILQKEGQLFNGTTLLSSEQQKTLNSWFGKNNQKWELIYKATRDGFQASFFHNKCDNQGTTFVIIRSSNNYLFGGYRPSSWNTIGSYDNTKGHFIFTLTNPNRIPPTKYQLNGFGSNGSYGHVTYGPTFGGGHDIYICENSNTVNDSYTNFPSSYQDTTGYGNNTFTGQYNFTTNEIEIFKLKH